MVNLFVVDTSALISYYKNIFKKESTISSSALSIIEDGFNQKVNLSIPSVVFIEIFKKWYKNEEIAKKFYYEIYKVIKDLPNIEIKPIEQEVLENFITLKIPNFKKKKNKFDNHDKIILSSAMMLNCPLITSDRKLIKYNKRYNVVSRIIK